MLSFKELNINTYKELSEAAAEILGEPSALFKKERGTDIEGFLLELTESFDEDTELAVTFDFGCILIRVFDMGRYCFIYPFEFSDSSDTKLALYEIAKYASWQQISMHISDMPAERISELSGFRHITLDAEDHASELYRVNILSEGELLDEIPEIDGGRVTLNGLSEDDIPEYARLCRDRDVNRFWGYDWSEDIKEPSDAYFFETSREEFISGESIPFAVRASGKLIGEALLYAFDRRGGCSIAIRLLKSKQGKGYAGEIFTALSEFACDIGISVLSAEIMLENKRSVAFAEKYMERTGTENGKAVFRAYIGK